MPTPILIEVGNVKLKAELDDSPTAEAIAGALPLESAFRTWGDEYYFTVPVDMSLDESATLEVQVGDLAYWPPEKALAIFYGPTPASPADGDRPVPASAVNPVGRVLDDPTILRVVAPIGMLRISSRGKPRRKSRRKAAARTAAPAEAAAEKTARKDANQTPATTAEETTKKGTKKKSTKKKPTKKKVTKDRVTKKRPTKKKPGKKKRTKKADG